MRRPPLWLVWVPGLLAVAILVAGGVATGVWPDRTESRLDSLWTLSWIGFPIVGAFIASRRPATRIGWVLMGIGISIGMGLGGSFYASAAQRGLRLPFANVMLWLSSWPFIFAFGLIPFLILLFPDDRLPSRRWRIPATVAGAVILLDALAWAVRPSLQVSQGITADNPLGIDSLASVTERVIAVTGFMLAAFAVIVIVNLIVRYFRSRGERRVQMKWFVYAAAMFPIMFGVASLFETFWSLTVSNVIVILAFLIGFNGLAVSIGIAITRYRLYDIDVAINKTVVYGGLAAFITAVYVGVVVGIGTLVGAGDKPNLGLSLAATAIVAVAFQPVRARVQRFANKLVYGERVTPYEAITSFSHRMAESLSLDQVLPRMAEAAAKGVGGSRSRVKLFLSDGGEQVVNWPSDSPGNSFDRSVPVVHQGEDMGEVSVAKAPGEQISKGEEKLLQDLASQAGLAMRNLRLTGELQQRLVELQESRKRIVAAQDQERRRMERDIHDGAQQQLVAMAVKLGLARGMIGKDQQRANQILDELKTGAQDAVESVRDLARGLFPQILTDRGLVEALQSHVDKMAIDALIRDGLHGARFDLEVEAGVYFCIREALQNASKHAPGGRITIDLSTQNADLCFAVKDEGSGFAPPREGAGSGLQNMRDRVEALGGLFEIVSSPGTGTSVTGRLPATRLAGSRT